MVIDGPAPVRIHVQSMLLPYMPGPSEMVIADISTARLTVLLHWPVVVADGCIVGLLPAGKKAEGIVV